MIILCVFYIFLFLLFSIQVICDDDATEAPNNKNPFAHDSSRIHEDKKTRLDARKNHRDHQPASFGVPVMHNPRSYYPPAPGSIRNDHMLPRSEIFKHKNDFRKPPGFVIEEGELYGGDGDVGGGAENAEGIEGEPCDIQCGSDEFLCSESCYCIADHLRCGKKLLQLLRKWNVV